MPVINLNNQIPSTTGDQSFEDTIALSQLGTPIFDDLTFPAGNYLTLEGVQVDYEEMRLVAVQYTVQQQKNIVRTQINGRRGTFKEYVNTGDYVIRGNAVLTVPSRGFPREEIIKFVDLKDVPEAVPVVSKILNGVFGIDDVVVSDFTVDPGNGSSAVNVSFLLESDIDFDLGDFIIVEND